MRTGFLAALALLFVLEGLTPLIAPRAWKAAFRYALSLSDGQLRFFGLLSVVVGAAFAVLAALLT